MFAFRSSRSTSIRILAFVLAATAAFTSASVATAEPVACLSFDPGQWPAPSRPYFMLAVDTSGSMTACTNPPTAYPTGCNPNTATPNSCGYLPTRYNDAKCALEQTLLAFSGQVNFGLSSFATYLDTSCGPNCTATQTCTVNNCIAEDFGCGGFCFIAEQTTTGNCFGCGPRPGNATTRAGAHIRVPMLQDHFWSNPPDPSNVSDLLSWMDLDCDGGEELYAVGSTPLNGVLRDMKRYFETGWTHPDNNLISYATPLDGNDLPGIGVNGGTGCRDVNVILLTDGDETCDTQQDAVNAAADLYQTGVTVGGKVFKIRTHVINFAGGTQANTDAIAAAGGTTASLFASNEVQLAQALANIVATAVQPEVCDNSDNNCNGCTDEGYNHYCNIGQTCCAWTTPAQRDACLATYQTSVNNNPPDGDLTLLPCITSLQQAEPTEWLCFDPGDICDEADNNCVGGVDEGQLKCGNPLTCPTSEICDGLDNDCDNQIDEGGVCGSCVPSPEVCDGCDNDCDGVVDNGTFPTIPCGLPSPNNCQGTASCQAPQNVPVGTCAQNAGYGACNNNPQAEVCDGIDNDCNGQTDEGYVSSACPPINGLSYGGASQCTLGALQCVNGGEICVGAIGPSPEICDNIDNDCNGQTDDNVPGMGQPCGINNLPCTTGVWACVNGAPLCQGGTGPQPEVCDGLDNDCDGNVDEAPLADGPQPGQTGCWGNSGTCCTHGNLQWCPPSGGTCYGTGSLSTPCNVGAITCDGGNGWICQGPVGPSPEVCDGIDNDCNNMVDDGNLPQTGQPCGTNVGLCMEGAFACVLGSLDCVGDVGPTQEICDNLDNDCNGQTDDNIAAGGPCTVAYDTNLYPNSNPTMSPCAEGQLQCDGMGNWICQGGIGPTPEQCDGLDNDCDGNVDENGTAPDGIDGSANPTPPPNANIGDACGVLVGACMPGSYQCLNGLFACIGGSGPIPESCDCEDNDCDGETDEIPGMGEAPLCSPGKDCVKTSTHCQCAEPCSSGEYPCPPGQKCEVVDLQGTSTMGQYCVVDYEQQCGDCTVKTIKDTNDVTVCAPLGTDPPGCLETPECDCKGPNGCQEPCFNVTCSGGNVCSNFGPTPGECVTDICYLTGCPGCNKMCGGGQCVDNPCQPDTCQPNQVAKPSNDYMTCNCVDTCADVNCPNGQTCKEGACVPWCDPLCTGGQVCDPGTLMCVDSLCMDDTCPNGAYCDPLTGVCGDEPCSGVICPDMQECRDGDCFVDESGTGGGGSGAGGNAQGGGATTGSSSGSGQGGAGGIFGLPTGGGGCSCDIAAQRNDKSLAWLSLLGLGLALVRRRRRGRGSSNQGEEVDR